MRVLVRLVQVTACIKPFVVSIAKGPLAVGLATCLDIFALALAKHRIAGNIRVSRVFGITPSGIEPIFKAFRVRGAIVFLPVGDMGLLVLLTGGGSLRGGVYLCHFVYIDQSREATFHGLPASLRVSSRRPGPSVSGSHHDGTSQSDEGSMSRHMPTLPSG
jgi:hypothetical protein